MIPLALTYRLDEVSALARRLLSIPDARPGWLKNMPSAMDEKVTQFARYHRFFFEYVRAFSPERILEIGTYLGSSAAHLAYGHAGHVVTVDIEMDAVRRANDLHLQNLTAVFGDSALLLDTIGPMGPFDAVFIDAAHDFARCYGDYIRYRPLVKPGGLMFFDDIHLCPEMDQAWFSIADRKIDLPSLHYTGFGACQIDPDLTISMDRVKRP